MNPTVAAPAEKSWLDTELCHRELLRAIPVAIYTCDQRGIITYFNQEAAYLWGRNPVIGQDSWCGSWKIYHSNGTPMNLGECPMAVALREGRPVRGESIVIERPDQTRRYVVPYPEPIRDSAGTVVGAVNTLMDLSDSEVGRTVLQSIVLQRAGASASSAESSSHAVPAV